MWEKNDEQKRILSTQSQFLSTLAEAVLGGVLVTSALSQESKHVSILIDHFL